MASNSFPKFQEISGQDLCTNNNLNCLYRVSPDRLPHEQVQSGAPISIPSFMVSQTGGVNKWGSAYFFGSEIGDFLICFLGLKKASFFHS